MISHTWNHPTQSDTVMNLYMTDSRMSSMKIISILISQDECENRLPKRKLVSPDWYTAPYQSLSLWFSTRVQPEAVMVLYKNDLLSFVDSSNTKSLALESTRVDSSNRSPPLLAVQLTLRESLLVRSTTHGTLPVNLSRSWISTWLASRCF